MVYTIGNIIYTTQQIHYNNNEFDDDEFDDENNDVYDDIMADYDVKYDNLMSEHYDYIMPDKPCRKCYNYVEYGDIGYDIHDLCDKCYYKTFDGKD